MQEFLNKEGNIESDLSNLNTRDEDLEQLIDELVQVFCFEDIDNNTEAQKA